MKKIYNFLFLLVLITSWNCVSAQAPYCTPTYTTGCTSGDGLLGFYLENIQQEIACDGSPNSWYNFYNDTITLTIGENHQLTVFTNAATTYMDVWIDFNDNNQFDVAEKLINGAYVIPFFSVAVNLNIPSNAQVGYHRMRYRTNRLNPPIDPCYTKDYGNSGDFIVNLVLPEPPGNALVSSPANGATGVIPIATLNWTPGPGALPSGYYLYLGTDNPPTNIVNGSVVSIPFYNPTPDLSINTTYYWKVVPFNSGGQAASAPVWSFSTIVGYGSLQGQVTNCLGSPVSGATITATGPSMFSTISDAGGNYQFLNIPEGSYTLVAQANSFNTTTLSAITVNAGNTTTQVLVMPQPTLSVLPNPTDVTLNPNEQYSAAFSVTNAGCGELTWSATIAYGSTYHDWFTMPIMNGTVSPSTNASIPADFNAAGLAAGTVMNATVTFTSMPNVGTVVVPVNMTVSGPALAPVTNLQVALTDPLSGNVALSWECTPGAGFLYYSVKRNGTPVASVTLSTIYNEILPTYGTYTYCVNAVYNDGLSTPECMDAEWPNPGLTWAPDSLIATVWPGSSVNLPLSIGNTGLGTLAYEFPDYVDHMGDSPMAYCAASATGQDEYIGRVQFALIDNTSGWESYSDYTSISTQLIKGFSVLITITNGGNAYSQDKLYVWIDYDHNNLFDATELTQLTTQSGGASFTGTIAVPSTALLGNTTMRVRMSYSTAADPCGSQTYGEVEDYTVNIQHPTFATNVVPASGIVSSGGTQMVNVTFSATNSYFTYGIYYGTLVLHSNDLSHPSVDIPLKMIVGMASVIQGVVTDCATGEPIEGVLVSVGSSSTMTDETGAYTLYVDAGVYDVVFSKVGYQAVTVAGVVAGTTVTTLNPQMCANPYPPDCAYASVNFEDTHCTVTWCPPAAVQEMIFDDGTAENYAAWQYAGNKYAVKYTPQGYPAHISGAKFMIGDGPYGNATGSPFTVLVCQADAAGLPGELLDSVACVVTNTGWLTVSLNATVSSGDFFIVMTQRSPSPDCAYLGVDETLPVVNRSYSRNIINGEEWQLSAYQDFMIRPIVSCPDTSGYIHYDLARIFLGAVNPVSPELGVYTLYTNSFTETTYTEGGTTWMSMQPGWYAYGIKARYPNNQESEYTFTNYVPHKMFTDLTVNVKQVCQFAPAEGAVVSLTGSYYPYDMLSDTVDASGTATFSHIIKGNYNMSVLYPGYVTYTANVPVMDSSNVNVFLEPLTYKPRNLYVDNTTLIATWEPPQDIALDEKFESGVFPPTGWQAVTQSSIGWFTSSADSIGMLPIPSHTVFAIVNDGHLGAGNDGCCDYLVTPTMNLTNASGYSLGFQSFYPGSNGQLASVEMSTDNGLTWTPIYNCSPSDTWQQVNIDLSAFSGSGGLSSVQFAFHADDAGNDASGWAVDDVIIKSGDMLVDTYALFYNGTEFGQTPELSAVLPPSMFSYGQTYTICVAADFCSNYSEGDCYTFTNYYLDPPLNLDVVADVTDTSGAAILTWQPPLNTASLLGYSIYRDGVFLAQVAQTVTGYTDLNLPPITFCYEITAVYDLTPFGFPGQFGESAKVGPKCVDIVYGADLPFFEDFSGGQFNPDFWTVGQNWLIDSESDNPVPAAKFKWDPLLQNYSSGLESFWINATGMDPNLPYKIYFDYEVKLEDFVLTNTEKLTVEVWNGSNWNTAKEYSNTGSFDWLSEHLDISDFAQNEVFKVKFRANGSSSNELHYWAVDNVSIYMPFTDPPPFNLVTQLVSPSGNDIKLTWAAPEGGGSLMSYILDDNSSENGVYLNAAGEGWIGNEFPVSDAGVLQQASVFLSANGSATYTFDVFDSYRNFVGSSAAFIPTFGEWTTIALPDIPFNGTFYLMLHMVVSTESGILNLDENGSNAAANYEWYYDGAGWSKLTESGFAPAVTFIRAIALVGDKKTVVTFKPGSTATNYMSPLAGTLAHKDMNVYTGSEVAHVIPQSDNIDSISGYNIYRRAYSVFPAGQNNTNSGNWSMIANVVPYEYVDADLSNLITNCYEYYVTTVYAGGESPPSNMDWECIFTDVNQSKTEVVRIYPNPATTFVRIDLYRLIDNITVYNSLGTVITQKNVKGETSVMLNTAGYAAGAYSVKFTTASGDTFSRKFIVTK